jgi:hypothetical protein
VGGPVELPDRAPVPLPDRVPGFVIAAGRAVGHDLPSLDARDIVAPWRQAIGGRGPFLVRLPGDDPAAIAHVQRLARVGELWLDTPLRSVDDALDLVVAGASRLVVAMDDADPELLAAVGPSALIQWDGQTPWEVVQSAALEHGVPVLAGVPPPPGAACDVFLVDGDAPGLELSRVASTPAPPEPDGDPPESRTAPAGEGK